MSSSTVYISKSDETRIRIKADRSILLELWDYFSYPHPSAAFIPAFRDKRWDGKVRLLNLRSNTLSFGLHTLVAEYCVKHDYEVVYEDPLDVENPFSVEEFRRMVGSLKLSVESEGVRENITPHDFQERGIIHAIQAGRCLLLSATASGKSLIIYVLLRFYLAKTKGKILIIVPTTALVKQLHDDFVDYAYYVDFNVEANCHMIYDGGEKHTDKRVVISTWQALAVKERLPKEFIDELKEEKTEAQVRAIIKKWNKQAPYILEEEYFHQFTTVFGDECLHPETNISMADGSLKQIQHVLPGDMVLTFSEQNKRVEAKPIVKQHFNLSKTKQMFNLTFADGMQLQITGNHKVKLRSGVWKRVDELVQNDDIINIGDEEMPLHETAFENDQKGHVIKIEPFQYQGDVYNLHVKDNHNYFANGNCVSNCHLFSGEDAGGGELEEIMSKLINARYRIGTTGTLKDAKMHHMVLEGIFGKVYQVISTRDMIDQKKAAELYIKCLQFQYSDQERKAMRKATYPQEMEFLQSHQHRNRFIRDLTLSLKGNTLVLFEKVEKHGKILHEMIQAAITPGRKLFYVHGKVDADDRNEVRKITEGETNAIIVASYGTFSTGVNIRNIDNIIFASPTKAKVRVLQSIGRGLRLSKRKFMVTLYDLADDLSIWNKAGNMVWDNYSLQHFTERINFYNSEEFDYKLYKCWLEANV